MTTTKSNIDAQKLKEQLDPLQVLSIIGYEKSNPKLSNGEIRDFCPIHKSDKQRSLSINPNTKTFICHSCKEKGTLIDLFGLAQGYNIKLDFHRVCGDLATKIGFSGNSIGINHSAEKAVSNIIPTQKEKPLPDLSSIFQNLKPSECDYADKKKVKIYGNVKRSKDEKGNPTLAVPMYQRISQNWQMTAINYAGRKTFHSGSKRNGAYFLLGSLKDATKIYICEGYATAATVYQALHETIPVAMAGCENNLAYVANAIHRFNPKLKRIMGFDKNSTSELKKIEGDIWWVEPNFDGMAGTQDATDFNDLKSKCGQPLEVIAQQLHNIKKEGKDTAEYHFEKNSRKQLREYYRNLQPAIKIGFSIDENNNLDLPTGAITTLAAPTGHGKTLVSVAMTLEAVLRNPDIQAIFFTLEETPEPIILRLLNCYCNIDLSKNNTRSLEHFYRKDSDEYIRSEIKEEFYRKEKEFFSNIIESGKIIVHCGFSSHQEMKKAMESLVKQHPRTKLIVVDYIQLMSCENRRNQSRTEELKEVSNTLRSIATKYGVAVLQTAQFNRDVSNEQEMKRTLIAESSEIEKNSENIICMYNRTSKQSSQSSNVNIPSETSNELFFRLDKIRKGQHGKEIIKSFSGNRGSVDFMKDPSHSKEKNSGYRSC